ncbi:hypothetical protein J6590_044872 [Homalodisca vitripennis]|nr:hypothetical protein J6590_044872 [Homalodisca vitripennis]
MNKQSHCFRLIFEGYKRYHLQRRVTASARYTAPRYDATPLLREQSVTFIAPRNTMETIASSAKSALWSLQQKAYKSVLKKDKEWEETI